MIGGHDRRRRREELRTEISHTRLRGRSEDYDRLLRW